MLHILWMILKIILITLGVLLGLILLLLLLVLFVPIRYRAAASRHGEDISAEGRVSWLLSAVSATVAYRGGQRAAKVRILGIPLETLRRLQERLRGKKRRAPREPRRDDSIVSGEPHPEEIAQDSAGEQRPAEEGPAPKPAVEEPPGPEPEAILAEPETEEGSPAVWERIVSAWNHICRLARAAWPGIVRAFRLIIGIPGRARRFFHRISLTITGFYGKIDRWKSFLQDERTTAGIRLGWGEIKKLLRHISPRRIGGNLIIGLDNPATTGQVLALFGATIPIHRNRVEIQPVFDRSVLEADVRMRGRVYLFYVLIIGMKLYFDKNIKYIMKEFNKEG